MVHSYLQLSLIRYEWARIFLRCGSKSQKLLMSLEGTKPCGSFNSREDKLLTGLEQKSSPLKRKILPHKKTFLRAMSIKCIVCFGWQFLRVAPTAQLCYPERHASTTTTHVVVVHSCVQLRFIRHEWGRIFFRCGSKSQKLLMSFEGTKSYVSFDPRADKLFAGLEQKSFPTVKN